MNSSLKKVLQVSVMALGLLMAFASGAEARNCSRLSEDLRAMQKAQDSLLSSMVQKNETMASTLDQYAMTLQSKKTVRKADVVGLRKSAQAFRSHHSREEKLVQRFQGKTDELVAEIAECLKGKTVAAE